MKRLIALVGGSLFLVGLPLVLILTGVTPIGVASTLVDAVTVRNPVQLGMQIGLLGLWSTWLWGFGSVIIDVVRTWGARHDHSIGVMSSRYSLLFVVALWSILFASRSAPAAARSVPSEQVVVATTSAVDELSHGAVPLALGSSTVLIAGLLTYVSFLRDKQLRLAPVGSFMPPISQRSAFTWAELSHRYRAQHADQIHEATQEMLNTGTGSPSVHVPIGLSANETVVVALAPGTRFDIVATDIELAKTAARHLIAVAQLAARGGSIRVVVESLSKLGGLDLSNEASLKVSIPDTNTVIRVVIDVSQDVHASSLIVASNEAVVKICVLSDYPNRMQLGANGWMLMPSEQRLSVFGLTEFETSVVQDLLTESSKPAEEDKRLCEPLDADWNVCVRLLGPVDAETRNGIPISFEKSKSLELLAWLTTHRERPTRVAARTALWEISVQDATFNNVVSGLRRGLASGLVGVEQIEFLPKTFTDQLSIHGSVITDVDVLNNAVNLVKNRGDRESWFGLLDALDRVRDLPFAGTDYLWPDSEGITSNFILSVITGSIMAAEHALQQGDTEGVFWATGQGLKVLHGHEELVALRMRAYGDVGDRVGVNAEWSSYERSLLHDSWSGGAPSVRMVDLKRELIG
jgi:two-component SAPR family response regulator